MIHAPDRVTAVTASRAIVDALLAAGVDHAFCVPGESFLGVLDALYEEPRIRVIATRHEGGASFMAEAYGKLTRRPAVCMGTRMVGGGNLAIGIHTARQDSTPLIALLGQVTTGARHREAFQEVELAQVFGPIVKWAVEPPRADRLGELTLRAARVAVSGRPGPVVVSLREDLLAEQVEPLETAPLVPPRPAPDPALVERTLELLRAAERPLLLVGGGVLAARAIEPLVRFADAEQVPVMAAWRRPDAFPNDHPLYLGQTGTGSPSSVLERLRAADLLVAIGTRFNELASYDYRVPAPSTRLVHVDIDPEGVGAHRLVPEVGIVSDATLFLEALLARADQQPASRDLLEARRERNTTDRAAWERQTTPARGRAQPGYVDQQAVMGHVRRLAPADAILINDAGNFSGWLSRYYRWRSPGTYLGPTSGAMGYAIPAAVGAKLARPDRKVVTLAGDGGFYMTGVEIETAVREQAPFVALVYDNEQYGTIRMHQLRDHPGRRIATALGPTDAAAFARALGGIGFTIRDEADFPAAFEEALAADLPAVLHMRVDPEQISVAADS